jgi:hypothetical protein
MLGNWLKCVERCFLKDFQERYADSQENHKIYKARRILRRHDRESAVFGFRWKRIAGLLSMPAENREKAMIICHGFASSKDSESNTRFQLMMRLGCQISGLISLGW